MKYYLQLMRPANLVTSVADIIAGIAISGIVFTFSQELLIPFILLSLSTIGLYGGGVVFNDIFDAHLDAIERPERPIPSGKVSIKNATLLGIFLIVIGLSSAYLVNRNSFFIAIIIAILALVYDKFGKHHVFLGPLNMGLCRGFNLLLGVSILPTALSNNFWLGILPVLYIAAITLISRSEVHGGNRNTILLAGILYLMVNISQIFMAFQKPSFIWAISFIFIHVVLIFRPLIVAYNQPIGAHIGKAVKAGVLAIVVMDAAWVAIAGNLPAAIGVMLLLPLSIIIAKAFAVT
jgi:hypothetical protein